MINLPPYLRAGDTHDTMPLPGSVFKWYVWFWHVAYVGALSVMLGLTIWHNRAALDWREAALAVLALAQVALYIRILVMARRWPLPWWQMAIYFGGSLALWYVEWRLEPNFFWFIMTYFGQAFGLLPPAGALPLTSAIFATVFLHGAGGDLANLEPNDVLGGLMAWVGMSVFYLFIYYVSRTSEERGRLVLELQAAHRQLEHSREREAELAALRERERLARDLHDNLGHALVALAVQLEAVQRLYRVDSERASAQLDELKRLTRDSMDDLRRSLDGLRAPGLGDRPLREAIQALCVETGQRLQLEVSSRVGGNLEALTPAVAETLWRATQEALTNVGKHARARRVTVALDARADAVTLRVADDGVGLPPLAESQPGHYGLRGIRERVEGLGGSLKLANGDGADSGAVLEARLPLL